LLSNEQTIQVGFNHDENTIFVGWLPLFHDMGLIGNVLQPLYLGITCVMMPPIAFLQKPIRWLQAISKYRATTSGGPNFAYELCYQKIQPENCQDLDLSSWKVAFNGAEPIHARTLKQFSEAFSHCGFRSQAFYPCYGMAEATLFITGGDTEKLPTIESFEADALTQNQAITATNEETKAYQIVSCGHQWLDHTIRIVDPQALEECPNNQIGEIWVSGSSVAKGYWNQPELTQATFYATLGDSEEHYLRTGDLGFLKDGELFVTGRLKDVIIIRGRNFYPQDIELSVEQAHPALRSNATAAFSAEIEGEERLVVVQEVERTYVRKLNVDETIEAIRRAVSKDHELQVHTIVLLKPGRILKTSSGKIQRQACKRGYLEQKLETVDTWEAPISSPNSYQTSSMSLKQSLQTRTEDAIQNWLVNWLAQRLGLALSSVNPYKAFADYGMDSVVAVELAQAIEDELGKEMQVDATLTWNFPTIYALSHYLADQLEKPSSPQPQSFNKTLQNTTPTMEELDTLSEEELAQRLIEEISLAQQRKVR
jgi:acyl-CoA synthetase (AMP-forming)/AMP-acid ligase II/acyl carrier protein